MGMSFAAMLVSVGIWANSAIERVTGSGFKYWGVGKGSSFMEERALSIRLRRRSATAGGYRARHESDELSPTPFSQSIAAAE